MKAKGKYRTRTAIRKRLPGSLQPLVPKGEDCGRHELSVVQSSPGGGAKIRACRHCRYEETDVTTANAERQQQARRHRDDRFATRGH